MLSPRRAASMPLPTSASPPCAASVPARAECHFIKTREECGAVEPKPTTAPSRPMARTIKHMKTNSFFAPTGSASSPATMLEPSCFDRICEFLIMWEHISERRWRPARVAHRSQPSSSCLEHSNAS